MKETDIIICLKKTNKGQKNIKKIIARLKNQRNFLFVFFFFFFQYVKWEKNWSSIVDIITIALKNIII